MPLLSDDVQRILANSFFIRTTMTRRSDGRRRTVETTYVWDGSDRVYLSGFPGKRDWVATMAVNPQVTVHTVEGIGAGRWYDIPAVARVLLRRRERVPHLLAFVERWARRPEHPRLLLRAVLALIKLNRRLHLPWWGPFYVVRRLLDRMPCVELRFVGQPVVRPEGSPPVSASRQGR